MPAKPEIRVADWRMQHLRLSDPDVVLVLQVHNPNRLALPLSTLSLEVQLNERLFADGHTLAPIELPAQGDALLEVTLHTRSDVLLRTLGDMLHAPGGNLRYRVTGRAVLSPFALEVPFDLTGNTDFATLLKRRQPTS